VCGSVPRKVQRAAEERARARAAKNYQKDDVPAQYGFTLFFIPLCHSSLKPVLQCYQMQAGPERQGRKGAREEVQDKAKVCASYLGL
jgi:hypothetical protein